MTNYFKIIFLFGTRDIKTKLILTQTCKLQCVAQNREYNYGEVYILVLYILYNV